MSKPIILYSHSTGPNPWKVAIVLEELGIPYETKFLQFPEMKEEPFEKLNINGRVPAIEDPNTGVAIGESGAIIDYLIDTYDKGGKLSYGDKLPERYQLKQWLHFQMSGQGPYFGQAAWFTFFHPEKNITSAIERYRNEIKRVNKVIDRQLARNGTGWLVGDKCTYADLSFFPWANMVPFIFGEQASEATAGLDHYNKWFEALTARPSVQKVLADKAKASGK